MPNVTRLGKGATAAIHKAIDEAFDRAKVRFLGPQSVLGKRIYIGFEREKSLPGIFEAGSREEGVKPDLDVLQSLLDIAANYIEATRDRTKARVINEINAAIAEARHAHGGMDRQDFRIMVNTKLSEVFGEVSTNIHAIVDTEVSRAKNTSVLDGIIGANAASGIEDPVVYFVVVRDNVLCDECKRLHLMPNGVTPRLWYLSELGHGFHKKGDDKPKLGGLHPHCRCTLVTLMPGYYFDRRGMVTYKKPGFKGIEWQRRMQRSEEPMVKAVGKPEKEWWRRPGRISLDEATKGFRYFRLVPDPASEYAHGQSTDAGKPLMIEHPRAPSADHVVRGENTTIPRVSMAPSIWHALAGLGGHILPEEVKNDPAHREDVGGRCHRWHIYGVRDEPAGLVGNDIVRQHVPDAHHTGEVWATQPVQMEHIGVLGGDYDDKGDGTYHVWVSKKP